MYLILGLARSGLATAAFLKARNIDFVVYDDRLKISEYRLLRETDWDSIKTVIVSPGVPVSYPRPHPLIEKALRRNIEIITDCTLLQRYAPEATFIGITGTNGKSTITALITHILKYRGKDAVMGGNIGIPVMELGLNHAIYVLELSSFQLERSPSFKLDVAVWVNMSEDHLEQHGKMDHYIAAKKRIFENAQHKIIGVDDSYSQSVALDYPDAIKVSAEQRTILPGHLYLRGKHNQQNQLLAYHALLSMGLSDESILEGMQKFKGLKHRQQYLGILNHITFINDSKATSANATAQALMTFDDDIYLFLGGKDKSDGIEALVPHFSKVKKVFLFGASRERFSNILNVCGVPYEMFERLDDAFSRAFKEALGEKSPVTFLFSPACASFDQYKDFEERGDHFCRLVDILLDKLAAKSA